MTVDFLIVGQGLAGSLLAWQLIQRHCKVLLLDNGKENASQIAAGLINPVTGIRLVKSTELELLLPVAKQTYQTLAYFFRQPFYIEKPMLRVLQQEKERLIALKRMNNPDYHAYLGDIITAQQFNNPLGSLEQKQTGYLLTAHLLETLKAYLISLHSYQQTQFNYTDITINTDLTWRGIKAKKIIFCEGYQIKQNPWFSYLPLQPVKGQILTLTTPTALPQTLLNYGHWFIPLNQHLFRTGATFDRDLNTDCTAVGKNNLLASLQKVFPINNATLIQQQANIRPCTLDKQPFIGQHPLYPQLVIFNGFGAKGSLQIPYYSQKLADNLLNQQPLPSHVAITRYESLRFF